MFPVSNLILTLSKDQVAVFKKAEAAILEALSAGSGKQATREETEESSVAKLVEEMKALPSRVAERLAESGEPLRRRRMRRFHPMMFEEMMEMSGDPGDPLGILMAASLIRDDAPWLYELAMEVYRAVKSGDPMEIEGEMARLKRLSEFTMRGPFMEEFGFVGKEMHIIVGEFPRMLHHLLNRTLKERELPIRRRRNPSGRLASGSSAAQSSEPAPESS